MNDAGIHATAFVIAATGYLLIGPSGAGKTSTALACIAAARRRGLHAALVADDRVLVSLVSGRIVARAPPALSGIAELRGAAIIAVDSVPAAVIDHVLQPVAPPFAQRLAPEDERCDMAGLKVAIRRLPLFSGYDPLDLLHLACAPAVA